MNRINLFSKSFEKMNQILGDQKDSLFYVQDRASIPLEPHINFYNNLFERMLCAYHEKIQMEKTCEIQEQEYHFLLQLHHTQGKEYFERFQGDLLSNQIILENYERNLNEEIQKYTCKLEKQEVFYENQLARISQKIDSIRELAVKSIETDGSEKINSLKDFFEELNNHSDSSQEEEILVIVKPSRSLLGRISALLR